MSTEREEFFFIEPNNGSENEDFDTANNLLFEDFWMLLEEVLDENKQVEFFWELEINEANSLKYFFLFGREDGDPNAIQIKIEYVGTPSYGFTTIYKRENNQGLGWYFQDGTTLVGYYPRAGLTRRLNISELIVNDFVYQFMLKRLGLTDIKSQSTEINYILGKLQESEDFADLLKVHNDLKLRSRDGKTNIFTLIETQSAETRDLEFLLKVRPSVDPHLN